MTEADRKAEFAWFTVARGPHVLQPVYGLVKPMVDQPEVLQVSRAVVAELHANGISRLFVDHDLANLAVEEKPDLMARNRNVTVLANFGAVKLAVGPMQVGLYPVKQVEVARILTRAGELHLKVVKP